VSLYARSTTSRRFSFSARMKLPRAVLAVRVVPLTVEGFRGVQVLTLTAGPVGLAASSRSTGGFPGLGLRSTEIVTE